MNAINSLFTKLCWHPKIRRLTFHKLINSILQFVEYKIKKINLMSMPSSALIDPTNICNLHCPLCPTGQGKHLKQGFISIELFKRTISQLGKYLYEVNLYNWGEPFLHKEIFQIIQIANTHNISTTISSNLNYFPEGYEKKLIESGLERLIVPLYGVTQNSHSAYRVGGSVEEVIDHIKRIIQYKEKVKSICPFIKITYPVNKFNETEIAEAKKIAKDLGVEIEFGPFMFNAKDHRLRQKWEPTITEYRIYDSKSGEDMRFKRYDCIWLWKNAVINFDGSVNPCCVWFENRKVEFGNINDTSFKKIWNNEFFQSARRTIKGEKGGIITGCTICLGVPPAMNEVKDQ